MPRTIISILLSVLIASLLSQCANSAKINVEVYNDLNDNLVRNSGEAGVGGIEVCIDDYVVDGKCGTNERRATTDSKGEVSFDVEGGQSYPVVINFDSTTECNPVVSIGDSFDINFAVGSELARHPQYEKYFEAAKTKLETVITGDLPDVMLNGVSIDDIEIAINLVNIDGPNGVLARAGPTYVRPDSYLPAKAVLEFDIEDAERTIQNGRFQALLEHEMLHCLGFGSLWELHNLVSDAGTTDPRYAGRYGNEEYRKVFGGISTATAPIQGTGDDGVRDIHWDEYEMQDEIMTGWVSSGSNPISTVTLGAMKDLGYQVNMAAAETYVPYFKRNVQNEADDATHDDDEKCSNVKMPPPFVMREFSVFESYKYAAHAHIGSKRTLLAAPLTNNFDHMPSGAGAFGVESAKIVTEDGNKYMSIGRTRSLDLFEVFLDKNLDINAKRTIVSFDLRITSDFTHTGSFFRVRLGTSSDVTFTLARKNTIAIAVRGSALAGPSRFVDLTTLGDWNKFVLDRDFNTGTLYLYREGELIGTDGQAIGSIDFVSFNYQAGLGAVHIDNFKFDVVEAPKNGKAVVLHGGNSEAKVFFPVRACGQAIQLTKAPTKPPTMTPTRAPTKPPTMAPTTRAPTKAPTMAPTTRAPTKPLTMAPTTRAPTKAPTMAPTTRAPTKAPTKPLPQTNAPFTFPPTDAPTSRPLQPIKYHEIRATLSQHWTSFTLPYNYKEMVVVCTPTYTTGVPRVVRVDQRGASRVNLKVEIAGKGTRVPDTFVHCVVVEAGKYDWYTHGIQMEAFTMISDKTASAGNWKNNRHRLSDTRRYFQPAVLGQVMSANDRWSVFWASNHFAQDNPDEFDIYVGKHVGEDFDRFRLAETLAVIIIDTASGFFETPHGHRYAYSAGDTILRKVKSMATHKPSPVTVYVPRTTTDAHVICSAAGIFDNDGGWPVVYTRGEEAKQTSVQINLIYDEDTWKNEERDHLAENAAYFVTAA